MLMGKYLLEDMDIGLEKLTHRNFARARELVEGHAEEYANRAEAQIEEALDTLFNGRARTLQRLSATFRRADLIELLL